MSLSSEKAVVVGIPVSIDNFSPALLDRVARDSEALIIASVNPLGCHVSRSNPAYVENLKQFDWVICDGIGMVVAARRIAGAKIERTTFDRTSLAEPVLQWAAENGVPLVVVGAKSGIGEQAGMRMSELTPGLQFEKAFSGYDENPQAAKAFLLDHPGRLVVCGMGSPRQEAFLLELKQGGWRGIGFTCGGFLDQLVERKDYFPGWVDRLHMRFLYRLCKEPRRLWRRYLVEYQVFLWRFAREYMSQLFRGNRDQQPPDKTKTT
jgi:N-acetylglucosaminyldiphosphoundecaprenol N-acetyl-beta-D-mannosaminyltransferase